MCASFSCTSLSLHDGHLVRASNGTEPKALKSTTKERGTKGRASARRCVRLARAPQRRETEQAALARHTHRSKPLSWWFWAAGWSGVASVLFGSRMQASAVVVCQAQSSPTRERGTKRRALARRCGGVARAERRRVAKPAALATPPHRSEPPSWGCWA